MLKKYVGTETMQVDHEQVIKEPKPEKRAKKIYPRREDGGPTTQSK